MPWSCLKIELFSIYNKDFYNNFLLNKFGTPAK